MAEIKWKYEIGDRLTDYKENGELKRDFTITDRKIRVQKSKYERGYKYYKCRCNVCNNDIDWIREDGLYSNKTGCFNCRWKCEINDRIVDYKDDGTLKRDITILERMFIKNHRWYKYKCNVCDWDEGLISESNLIQHKAGCSCCRGFTIVKGINTVGDLRPDLIQYFKNKEDAYCYTIGTPKKAKLICPDCFSENETSVHRLVSEGFRCKDCGNKTSYPERFMQQVLNQLNVEYIFQLNRKTFDWCDIYIYDFYLPKYNCIIEVHGAQHYPIISRFYNMTYDEIHKNDVAKQQLAELNGIEKYIIINASCSDNEYLKKSINNELERYFNLKVVDWNKCAIDASKSILIEVCKCWKETKKTTSQIGEIFNLNRTTIKNYLKKGAKLGLCEYDGGKEKARVKKMSRGHEQRDKKLTEICDFYNKQPGVDLEDIAKAFETTKRTIREYLKLGNERNLCVYHVDTQHDKKKIGVYKDGKLVHTHFGASDLAEKSLDLFGVKLCQGHLCSVCRGERRTHKGFVFKYLD